MPPPLRAAAHRPGDDRSGVGSEQMRWRLRNLLLAPHRLGFFLAMCLLAASGLWWALVQIDRATGWAGLTYASPPTLTHGALMGLGFVPLFFAGFLFTAGPKWLGVRGPEAPALLISSLLQAAGWMLWLAGSHLNGLVAALGVGLAAVGLGLQTFRFWGLVRASAQSDRVHAKVVALAGGVGVLSVAGIAVATAFGEVNLALAFVKSGLWGFVVPTYLAVAHRMIPFFTSSAVPMVEAWRPFWVLWVMLAAATFELVSVWVAVVFDTRPAIWLGLQGLVELGAGALLIWLGVIWGLVQSLKVRLLAMLHLGFVWLGLSFVLAGVSNYLWLLIGSDPLPLASLHALTMGCLGSLLVAMVTRVACGHSGRTLIADNMTWAIFWGLQGAVILRIAGAWLHVPLAVLVVSALAWACALGLWSLRLMAWLGRPRVDGRPG